MRVPFVLIHFLRLSASYIVLTRLVFFLARLRFILLARFRLVLLARLRLRFVLARLRIVLARLTIVLARLTFVLARLTSPGSTEDRQHVKNKSPFVTTRVQGTAKLSPDLSYYY